MNCRPKPAPGGWNVGFLHHLHSGEEFGPIGTALAMLSGVALVFFAFSGLWMYVQMFRGRARCVGQTRREVLLVTAPVPWRRRAHPIPSPFTSRGVCHEA